MISLIKVIKMNLINGNVFLGEKFEKTNIKITNNKISDISLSISDDDVLDCTDKYIIPGLVDIHTHGCTGYDFSSASAAEIKIMQKYYLKHGITSVLATTVSLSDNDILSAVNNIKSVAEKQTEGSRIAGINLEGPYLSPKKCGAHNIDLLKEPDIDFIESLGDYIKVVHVAPEYNKASDFITKFKGKTSIAHTDCDYSQAMNAIEHGADHITHIFNAMNGLHHRNPGVIGAFFDSEAVAELICDGIHVKAPILRMMFKAYAERIAIISDSMAATGLSNGKYKLGDLDVIVSNSVATLEDGTLAGSTMNIYDMMRNLISIGVDAEKAIASVTQIPAKSVAIDNNCGIIKVGRNADMVILNSDFSIDKIIFDGKIIS